MRLSPTTAGCTIQTSMQAVVAAALCAVLAAQPMYAAPVPKRGPTAGTPPVIKQMQGDERILHALNRMTFGPRPGDVAAVKAMGLDKWFESQLNPAQIDDSALEAKLAMAGKSREEIAAALKTAWEKKELTEPGVGAMSYMMSKKQYLGDEGHSWHPHLMWFAAGDAAKSWGANVEGSPVMAAPDLGDRMTIFLVALGKWSDGTAAPVM